MKFYIYHDSREKSPWNFTIYNQCIGQEKVCLKTGDYAIKDYPNLLIIERKRETSELANNLFRKGRQFEDELIRMKNFKYRFLICEFSQDDLMNFPIKSSIPHKYWSRIKVRGISLMKKLNELCEEYEVQLFFCDNRSNAERKAYELIKNIMENIENG